jgi:hypothetical protein
LASTHTPSQRVKGSRQVLWQTPSSQLARVPPVSGQARPQAPQFWASVVMSMQTVPQAWYGRLQ